MGLETLDLLSAGNKEVVKRSSEKMEFPLLFFSARPTEIPDSVRHFPFLFSGLVAPYNPYPALQHQLSSDTSVKQPWEHFSGALEEEKWKIALGGIEAEVHEEGIKTSLEKRLSLSTAVGPGLWWFRLGWAAAYCFQETGTQRKVSVWWTQLIIFSFYFLKRLAGPWGNLLSFKTWWVTPTNYLWLSVISWFSCNPGNVAQQESWSGAAGQGIAGLVSLEGVRRASCSADRGIADDTNCPPVNGIDRKCTPIFKPCARFSLLVHEE